jgi:hypothetical protein
MRRSFRSLCLVVLLLAFLLALSGCEPTVLPGPTVYLDIGEAFNLRPLLMMSSQWTAEDMKWIQRGAMVWRELGYDVRPVGEEIDGSLDPSQVIVIQVYRDTFLQMENKFGGLSDITKQTTFINAGLTDYSLLKIVAHEMGHQLIKAPGHLPAESKALMSPTPKGWDITDADLEYACKTAKRCKRY